MTGDLNGVQGHEVKLVCLSGFAEVPLDGWRRALKGDVVAGPIGLGLLFPLDDLGYRLHPLLHGLAWRGGKGKISSVERGLLGGFNPKIAY